MNQIKTPVWYHTVNVRVAPHNKSLGLEDIKVYPANEIQRSHRIVCNCTLRLISGTVRVTIFESKNNPGTLYLVAPGNEKVNDTYYENVQLKYELKALVLKYVESLMK